MPSIHEIFPALHYRSNGASVYDAAWSADAEIYGKTLEIEPGSVVFLRSGLLQLQGQAVQALIDANHILFAAQSCRCAPIGAGDGSCSIFRFERPAFAALLRLHKPSVVRLSSPGLFLRHWHALCRTRSQRPRAALIERAIAGLYDDLSKSDDSARRTAHYADVVFATTLELNQSAAPLRILPLAESHGMSPFTLSRAFHREVGLSIRHYGKRLRLRKALQLMLDSDAELSSIAIDLGFFDQAHFSNAFRQDFSVPPSLVLAAHRSKALGSALQLLIG